MTAITTTTQKKVLSYNELEHIFPYLDAKSLKTCAQVCKLWKKASENNRLWFVLINQKSFIFNKKSLVSTEVETQTYSYSVDYKKIFFKIRVPLKFSYMPLVASFPKEFYSKIHNSKQCLCTKIFSGSMMTLMLPLFEVFMGIGDVIIGSVHASTKDGEYCGCGVCGDKRREIQHKEDLLNQYSSPSPDALAAPVPRFPCSSIAFIEQSTVSSPTISNSSSSSAVSSVFSTTNGKISTSEEEWHDAITCFDKILQGYNSEQIIADFYQKYPKSDIPRSYFQVDNV